MRITLCSLDQVLTNEDQACYTILQKPPLLQHYYFSFGTMLFRNESAFGIHWHICLRWQTTLSISQAIYVVQPDNTPINEWTKRARQLFLLLVNSNFVTLLQRISNTASLCTSEEKASNSSHLVSCKQKIKTPLLHEVMVNLTSIKKGNHCLHHIEGCFIEIQSIGI